MKIKLLLTIFFSLYFLIFTKTASFAADQNFDISVSSQFQISETGKTKVIQKIKIVNKKEFIFTPSYGVTLGYKDLKNLYVSDQDGSIPNSISDNSDGTKSIDINFSKRIVGVGKVNEFTLSFDTNEVAKQNGSIWEVNIPGLSKPDDFSSYSITLSVPDFFGPPTVTKPPKYLNQNNRTFVFYKDDIAKSGIFLLFGQNQYYNLHLKYNISNSNLFPIKTEIALPLSTGYQDVLINSISPKPSNVYFDSDGNILATYILTPQQKETVNVTALVKSYSRPKGTSSRDIQNDYLSSEKYWEVNDAVIRKHALELKTPSRIYNFVVNNLSYDYDKALDNNTRVGAKNILSDPSFSVCLEFTDLFIALARAAGIPARAVEGYAHTENSKLKPISLVKDVLHAWPEYYDSVSKSWMMVDPTWENTTKGMDYFSSFDFDHIAFVVKGKSSTYPVPAGGYKFDSDSKDVDVTFAKPSSFIPVVKNDISVKFPSSSLSGFSIEGESTITNTGNTEISASYMTVKSSLIPNEKQYFVDSIPPFGSKTVKMHFEKTPILTNSSYEVTILFNGNSIKKTVHISIFPDPIWLIIAGGVILGLSIFTIITYKTWRILIQRLRK